MNFHSHVGLFDFSSEFCSKYFKEYVLSTILNISTHLR